MKYYHAFSITNIWLGKKIYIDFKHEPSRLVNIYMCNLKARQPSLFMKNNQNKKTKCLLKISIMPSLSNLLSTSKELVFAKSIESPS